MKIQSLERTVESKESRESSVFLSFSESLIELSPVSTWRIRFNQSDSSLSESTRNQTSRTLPAAVTLLCALTSSFGRLRWDRPESSEDRHRRQSRDIILTSQLHETNRTSIRSRALHQSHLCDVTPASPLQTHSNFIQTVSDCVHFTVTSSRWQQCCHSTIAEKKVNVII